VAERHAVGQVLECYRALSGARNSYSFFAPSVASRRRVRFTLFDGYGNCWSEATPAGANFEVTQRILTSSHRLSGPENRGNLAASWAGTLLARRPDADRVVVIVERYDLPTLDEYRAGARPRWVEEYEAAFDRAPAASAPEDRRP
jgi:hypothetical protein